MLTCKIVHQPRGIHVLQFLLHFPLQPLDVTEPLEPVGGVGVALVVDVLDVDDGGEVAVERDLADVPRQVRVGDDAGGGEVAQLRLQLGLAHHGHTVVLEIQGLN